MVETITFPELKALSFPDSRVLATSVDFLRKRAAISVDGAWLDIAGGRELGAGELRLTEWASVTFQEYLRGSEHWATCETHVGLKDLCEVELSNDLVVLFSSTTGNWAEWRFECPRTEYVSDSLPLVVVHRS